MRKSMCSQIRTDSSHHKPTRTLSFKYYKCTHTHSPETANAIWQDTPGQRFALSGSRTEFGTTIATMVLYADIREERFVEREKSPRQPYTAEEHKKAMSLRSTFNFTVFGLADNC